MKKNIIITVAVIVANVLAYNKVNAQQSANTQMAKEVGIQFTDLKTGEKSSAELIADETVLIVTGEKARIECDNQDIFMNLFKANATYSVIIQL